MRALVLAAGLGSRLGALTQTTPKALIPVGDHAILDHSVRKLLDVGITEVLINTHYLSSQVEAFLSQQNYRRFITTVYEPELLGTAGTVRANWNFFEDRDFLVMHGDNFFTASLKPLLVAHENRTLQTDMTMATFDTETPASCGTVITNKNGVVVKFYEKSATAPSLRANAAIYVFSPDTRNLFFNLPTNENDISLNVIPKLLGRIQAHYLPGDFIDIGSPAGLDEATKSYLRHQENGED